MQWHFTSNFFLPLHALYIYLMYNTVFGTLEFAANFCWTFLQNRHPNKYNGKYIHSVSVKTLLKWEGSKIDIWLNESVTLKHPITMMSCWKAFKLIVNKKEKLFLMRCNQPFFSNVISRSVYTFLTIYVLVR